MSESERDVIFRNKFLLPFDQIFSFCVVFCLLIFVLLLFLLCCFWRVQFDILILYCIYCFYCDIFLHNNDSVTINQVAPKKEKRVNRKCITKHKVMNWHAFDCPFCRACVCVNNLYDFFINNRDNRIYILNNVWEKHLYANIICVKNKTWKRNIKPMKYI